jgi:dTDP-L-rhamnose 4-epimerase
MRERVLVTGGAGFIGRRLAQHLLHAGYHVRILDALIAQVHGSEPALPDWMRGDCDLQIGDVRDRDAVARAVEGVDSVIHLAAETGTAQSMYAIHRYVDVNVSGTAMLLDCLVPRADRLRRLVIASSRAVYGEGKYDCARCGVVYPQGRSRAALAAGQWEPLCPECAGPIAAMPTDEDSRTQPTSTYGATKRSQELLGATFGPSFGVPVAALRYQNVYGAGQSLGNPYTGILTHFFSALRRHEPPRVFEDGLETRDFVHVEDAVAAAVLALTTSAEGVFNVGSGVRTSILSLAAAMCRSVAPGISPVVVSEYRVGDIRHCVADLQRARARLNYVPRVSLDAGLAEFTAWAAGEPVSAMSVSAANRELVAYGLLRSADGA